MNTKRRLKLKVVAGLLALVVAFALMPAQMAFANYVNGQQCPFCGTTMTVVGEGDAEHSFHCSNRNCQNGSGGAGDEHTFLHLEDHFGGTATCKHKAICEGCGWEYGNALDPDNHEGSPTVTGKKEATCTEKGYTGDTVWDCCGAEIEKGEEIAALGHKGGTATCTAKAVCDVCHEEYGEPLGHDWGAWTVTKEATTSEEGVETRVCKNDSSHTETRTIAKKEETNEEESEEKTTKANSESKTKKTTTDSHPQTGDESQSTWVIMMMLSAALLIALIRRRIYIRE